jgi:histidinol-phosphate aminotransferase
MVPKQVSSQIRTGSAAVERWIRPEIRNLDPYHVPDAGDFIKLDAMENPYTWPDSLVDEWLDVLRDVSFNRYPDPTARKLKQRLCESFAIPGTMEVLLGNGSDELIQLIMLAVSAPGRIVLAPEPSFSMYRLITATAGMKYVGVPLCDNFSLDVDAMIEGIATHQPAVVFLSYPNNPSGNLFDVDAMEMIIEASPGLVVVDEAYHAFSDATFVSRLEDHHNLLVLRTLSKMGLAGLRLGLLAGSPVWLSELNKIRLPYNINILVQVSAEFALGHQQIFDSQTRQICRDRDALQRVLHDLDGISVFPSHANFILFRVPAGLATEIFEAIKSRDVLIKNMHPAGGLLSDCLRVTTGRPDENLAFVEALKAALE